MRRKKIAGPKKRKSNEQEEVANDENSLHDLLPAKQARGGRKEKLRKTGQGGEKRDPSKKETLDAIRGLPDL